MSLLAADSPILCSLLKRQPQPNTAGTDRHVSGSKQRLKPLAPRVSDAEKKAHLEMVATLGDQAMWRDHIWKEQT